MAQERLQKILARAGIASRRRAEELITAGRVKVDGRRVTDLGTRVDARAQKILLDEQLVTPEPLVYVLFHKPRGVVCTMSDPEGRQTVSDYIVRAGARVVPVGRLDFHTSGVLLLTNDGEFSLALQHPSKKVPKLYVAKVQGVLDAESLEKWERPINIDGVRTRPAEVRRMRVEGDKTWLQITLHEGKNRQIHRIAEANGSMVWRLARVSFAGITHEGLRPGQWRHLSKDELVALKKTYGFPKRIWPAPPLPKPVKDDRKGARRAVAGTAVPNRSAARRSTGDNTTQHASSASAPRKSSKSHPSSKKVSARARASSRRR